MAKAAASSALEDLDLSGEEVQKLTSAFQDPEFRRMFSEYTEELNNPENRRRYEAEITALERERGVEVRFVHPEPGHVLRTSLDGAQRCFVNVCSNPLIGAPSSRPGPGRGGTAAGSHWSLPYSLAPGRPYAGRSGSRYTVYDVVFHPDALALAGRHERFREMLDATALEALEQQFGIRLDRRNAKTPVDDGRGKAQFNKARRQLVVTLPVAQVAARRDLAAAPEESAAWSGTDAKTCASAREGPAEDLEGTRAVDTRSAVPDAEEELVSEQEDFGRDSVSPPGLGDEPPPGAGNSPACPFRGPDPESAERRGAPGELSTQARAEPRIRSETAGADMGGPETTSTEPLCPPLQCTQDEDLLTLLIQVPRIQPQSLLGDLTALRYKLCFSTQDSTYSFSLHFAPDNKLSTKEPVISISLNNAVIVLAKSPESHGHWREWYCGLNDDSLEERLFVNEENVNEFIEEVLRSPLKQARPLTSPLIEVLQVTDEKIHIHAKLQECSNPDELQGEEKGVNEGCQVTEKENTEHSTTSPTDSDSSVALEALKIDTCGLVESFHQECPDVSQMAFEKSQQPEAKLEPELIKDGATCSSKERENKEPIITKEKELDGDHLSSSLNKTAIQNASDFDTIKETNMQDGCVQIIKDHMTHCAFSFQNSLLYDLD